MECSSILKNDKDSIKYRRNLNTLVVLGTGVIIFGFWGIIKIIAQAFFGLQIIDPADLEGLGPVGVVITMILTAAILSLDVILRLYVGLRARREAGGKNLQPSGV